MSHSSGTLNQRFLFWVNAYNTQRNIHVFQNLHSIQNLNFIHCIQNIQSIHFVQNMYSFHSLQTIHSFCFLEHVFLFIIFRMFIEFILFRIPFLFILLILFRLLISYSFQNIHSTQDTSCSFCSEYSLFIFSECSFFLVFILLILFRYQFFSECSFDSFCSEYSLFSFF